MIKTSELFPKYYFLIFLIIIFVIELVYDKIKLKQLNNTTNIIFIILVSIISSIAINIVSLSSFGLGRMVFSVGALIGLIFMYLYCTTDILEGKSIYKWIMRIILCIYCITIIFNEMNILYQHKHANKLDEQECKAVGEYIKKYEEENNMTVTKITYCYDNSVTWYYNHLSHKSLFTHRALMIWWCNIDAINYYNNLNLEKVGMPKQIYDKYFKDKDWDEFSEEQFVFIDDTLYYCIY